MADHQKIHPIFDPEKPIPQPISSKSDKFPTSDSHSKPPKKRNCFYKCLFWTLSLILLQIFIFAILIGIIFLFFQPKIPNYSVDKLQITQFNFTQDSNLQVTIDVIIIAKNPNKKIGIYYESGSQISVWYNATKLCEGSLPEFYQGHRNITVLNLPLTGKTSNPFTLLSSLQEEQKELGFVTLSLRVNQPVKIRVGKLNLIKFRFLVRCRMEVDSLSTDNMIMVRNNRCKYGFRL